MKKRLSGLCLSLVVLFSILIMSYSLNVQAAQGKLYISISDNNIEVGDTVTITAKAVDEGNSSISTAMEINYDMGLFSFVSCSAASYQGGEGGTVKATGSSVDITLKAKKSGSGGVSANAGGTSAEEITGASAPVTVAGAAEEPDEAADPADESPTVGENENKSSDNSLSQLSVSHGTLTPEFQYNVTAYTINVGPDVSEITIDAKPSNAKAAIESIEGNKNLKAGTNTVKINVKAENGEIAVYTISVSKDGNENQQPEDTSGTDPDSSTDDGTAAEDKGIVIGGIDYTVSADFPSEEMPKDFQETTINYKGQEVKAARFNNGYITLLYLTSENADAKNGLYVYNETQDVFQPLIKVSFDQQYIIILYPSVSTEVPEGYRQTELEVLDRGGVIGYQLDDGTAEQEGASLSPEKKENEGKVSGVALSNLPSTVEAANEASEEAAAENTFGEPEAADHSDFYLLYAMNNEGVEGWYQYDAKDTTFQRFVGQGEMTSAASQDVQAIRNTMNELEDQHRAEKAKLRRGYIIFVIIIVLLIFAIINILLFSRKREKNAYDDVEEESIFNLKTIMKEKRREEAFDLFEVQEEVQKTRKLSKIEPLPAEAKSISAETLPAKAKPIKSKPLPVKAKPISAEALLTKTDLRNKESLAMETKPRMETLNAETQPIHVKQFNSKTENENPDKFPEETKNKDMWIKDYEISSDDGDFEIMDLNDL